VEKEIITEGNTRGNVKPDVSYHTDGCDKPDRIGEKPINPPKGPTSKP
jgi:hypothetical protein